MQEEINIPVILDAVKKIGKVFLKKYKKKAIPQTFKALLKQLDDIDSVCMASLKADLADAFPSTPWFVGDEFDTDAQRNPANETEYWLCDAMDGAIQYIQHISGWSINLVLIRHGQPYFSVIYDPLAKEMFWAKEGAGAFMNGKALKPSKKTDSRHTLAVFEYGHQDKSTNNLNQKIGTSLTHLLENFGVVRNYGPHGLQLAYVGAGRIDLFHQEDLDTFNWLAGILIAKEAGARILTTDGQPWKWGDESLMVAASNIGETFLKRIQINKI
jgi:myo-inositol-1(or 4)-monophosphatase